VHRREIGEEKKGALGRSPSKARVQTAKKAERIAHPCDGDYKAIDSQGRDPRADPHRPRAALPERDESERDVHDQQRHLHRQPGVDEGILRDDSHQHQRRCEQHRIDGVAEIAQRFGHGPTREERDPTQQENPAAGKCRGDVDKPDFRVELDHPAQPRAGAQAVRTTE
jgi:hypothetical protein